MPLHQYKNFALTFLGKVVRFKVGVSGLLFFCQCKNYLPVSHAMVTRYKNFVIVIRVFMVP